MEKNGVTPKGVLNTIQMAKAKAVSYFCDNVYSSLGISKPVFDEQNFGLFEDRRLVRSIFSNWLAEEIGETALSDRDSDSDYKEDHCFWEAMSIVNLFGIIVATTDHADSILFNALKLVYPEYLNVVVGIFDVLLETPFEDLIDIQQRKIARKGKIVPYLKPEPEVLAPIIFYLRNVFTVVNQHGLDKYDVDQFPFNTYPIGTRAPQIINVPSLKGLQSNTKLI